VRTGAISAVLRLTSSRVEVLASQHEICRAAQVGRHRQTEQGDRTGWEPGSDGGAWVYVLLKPTGRAGNQARTAAPGSMFCSSRPGSRCGGTSTRSPGAPSWMRERGLPKAALGSIRGERLLMAGRRVPIGTVADRYGVPATTLRSWEDIGLLPPQERSGGQRRYDMDALRLVVFIRMAKQSGLSLNAIRALLAGDDHHSLAFGLLKLPPADWCTD